jgi:hypothetical protein
MDADTDFLDDQFEAVIQDAKEDETRRKDGNTTQPLKRPFRIPEYE